MSKIRKKRVKRSVRGKPSSCHLYLVKQVADLLRDGNYFDVACRAAGVNVSTAQGWKDRGTRALERSGWDLEAVPEREFNYALFTIEVMAAEAVAETTAVRVLREHGEVDRDGDHRATKEFLSRRFPERWGNQQRVTAEVSQQLTVIPVYGDEDPLAHDYGNTDAEEAEDSS